MGPELALLPLFGKRAWRDDRANDSPQGGVSHVLQVGVYFWLTATRGRDVTQDSRSAIWFISISMNRIWDRRTCSGCRA
jgi:hypothetical protein